MERKKVISPFTIPHLLDASNFFGYEFARMSTPCSIPASTLALPSHLHRHLFFCILSQLLDTDVFDQIIVRLPMVKSPSVSSAVAVAVAPLVHFHKRGVATCDWVVRGKGCLSHG